MRLATARHGSLRSKRPSSFVKISFNPAGPWSTQPWAPLWYSHDRPPLPYSFFKKAAWSPCVVVNFDTATTLLAVDSTGALVGGSILPGPQCSLSALVRNTAQLPQVELEARPRRLLGANTADCLHSGIVYGTAAMLDGMVAQIRAALGAPDAPVVATGTLPDSVRTACATDIVYRETLVLEGLYWIWKKNTRK